jgi:hypothetical protein
MDAMTDRNRDQEALARLNRALVDDILAASDESILAEVKEEGSDAAAIAAAARALFEKTAAVAGKTLLATAKVAVAADRRRPGASVLSLDAAAARRHLQRLFVQHPDTAQKLTLAARKGQLGEFSDEEVFGLLEDLADLGIVLPEADDPSTGR